MGDVHEEEDILIDVHEEEELIDIHATQGELVAQSVSEATTIVAKPADHPTVFGKDVHGRILEEIVEGFIVKRGGEPPRIPLCRLMENEAIRAVGPGTEGLVKRFEMSGYSVLGAPFLVSFKKPGHDQHYVSDLDKDEWGPIWREISDDFDNSLPLEWEDLRAKKFIVWDGNHRLKAWMRLIKTRK